MLKTVFYKFHFSHSCGYLLYTCLFLLLAVAVTATLTLYFSCLLKSSVCNSVRLQFLLNWSLVMENLFSQRSLSKMLHSMEEAPWFSTSNSTITLFSSVYSDTSLLKEQEKSNKVWCMQKRKGWGERGEDWGGGGWNLAGSIITFKCTDIHNHNRK